MKIDKTDEYFKDLQNTIDKEVSQMKNDDGKTEPSDIPQSTQFDSESSEDQPGNHKTSSKSDKDKEPTAAEKANADIKSRVKTKVRNAVGLNLFNRRYGRLFGYITQNDSLFCAVARSTRTKDERGNYIARIGREAEFNNTAAGKTPAISDCQVTRSIHFKEKAPGKILAMILSIPEGGQVNLTDLRQSGEGDVPFDNSKTETTKQIIDKQLADYVIMSLFGGKIRESEETFGESAKDITLEVRPGRARIPKDSKSVDLRTPLRFVYRVPEKRSTILPGTYLPINTFDTKSDSQITSEEDINAANMSTFIGLIGNGNALPKTEEGIPGATASNYHEFEDEVKKKIKIEIKNGEGVIVSPYFTTGEPVALKVPTFYDSDKYLEDIQVPFKTASPKKTVADKTKGDTLYRYIKISAIPTAADKELSEAEREEKTQKSSLHLDKFKSFREKVGDILNEGRLRSIVSKSNSGSSSSSINHNLALEAMSGVANDLYSIAGKTVNFDEIAARFTDLINQ